MASAPLYRRVLLKISGEAFCTPGGSGIDADAVQAIITELASLREMQVQVGLVVGGGNFLRGRAFSRQQLIPRATADAMGMLATVINALALEELLASAKAPARVLSAVPTGGFCEVYDRRRAIRHLEAGRLVILAGGTGSPFFTTDTCAALRANELDADALLKATKVDGVFEADPVTNPKAKKFSHLTYGEVLARQLGVMDLAAVSLCMQSQIPVIVFCLAKSGNLAAVVRGEPVGTSISVS